jgi:hypothetical protein
MIYGFDEDRYDPYTGSEDDELKDDDESDEEGARLVSISDSRFPVDVDKLDATPTLRPKRRPSVEHDEYAHGDASPFKRRKRVLLEDMWIENEHKVTFKTTRLGSLRRGLSLRSVDDHEGGTFTATPKVGHSHYLFDVSLSHRRILRYSPPKFYHTI